MNTVIKPNFEHQLTDESHDKLKNYVRSQFIINAYEMGREWAISFLRQEEKHWFDRYNFNMQTACCEILWETFTNKL